MFIRFFTITILLFVSGCVEITSTQPAFSDNDPALFKDLPDEIGVVFGNQKRTLKKLKGSNATYETSDFSEIRFIKRANKKLEKYDYLIVQAKNKENNITYYQFFNAGDFRGKYMDANYRGSNLGIGIFPLIFKTRPRNFVITDQSSRFYRILSGALYDLWDILRDEGSFKYKNFEAFKIRGEYVNSYGETKRGKLVPFVMLFDLSIPYERGLFNDKGNKAVDYIIGLGNTPKKDAQKDLPKPDFYWSVALRSTGAFVGQLGVGKSYAEANNTALEKCNAKRQAGVSTDRCRVVASFSSNEKACVETINGSTRTSSTRLHLFHAIEKGGERCNYDATSQCKKYGSRLTSSNARIAWDCRNRKTFSTSDARRIAY